MHKKTWIMLLLIFVFTLSACGGEKVPAPAEEITVSGEAQPAEETAPTTDAPAEVEAPAKAEIPFPLPDDVTAEAVTDLGNGSISLQTSLSLPDSVAFYRATFTELGYTEREINTAITDTTFSLVFDGHESGKAIVVQGVDLGEKINITLRFEDL